MYFIVSGEVRVNLHPTPVTIGPGSFFGEMAVLGDHVRNATVVTTLPSTLPVLNAADFRSFTAHHPEFAQQIEDESLHR